MMIDAIPFAAISALSIWAVLNPKIQDNTLERIGLALVGIGAAVRAWVVSTGCAPSGNTLTLICIGLAVAAAGFLWEFAHVRSIRR